VWVSVGEINGDGERDMVVTPNNATTQAYIAVSNNLGALTVTTSVDEDDGSTNPALGTGASLREAVNHANSLGGAQTITFSPALAGQTMSLTITGDNTFGPSALRVNANLTIQGLTGTNGIRIARGSSSSLRLFFVNQTATLTLNELVLADGSISGQGGAVYNYGTLRVNRCTLRNNTGSFGGAIGSGGGAAGQTVVVTNSTLISNRASFGGAIHSDTTSSLSLTNVTVITNDVTTNSGGGIRCDGPATIVNSMIVGNFNLNGDPSDVSASLDSSSHHNFIGSGGSGGLVNGVNGNRVGNDDPRVDFLPDLIALRADSPCINAGATVSGLTTDQRGVARPQYGAFDIGAYEFDGTLTESLVVTTTTDENDGNSSPVLGTGTSLREAIAYAGALNDNSAVTFSPAMGGQTFIVNGALSLGGTASLDGGTSGVTVRASASRIFDVTGNWTLRNLTATGGRLSGSTQAGWGPGALVNTGASLTVDRCLFLDHESNVGGGITSRGTLHIVNSTFTNNRTTASTLNSGVIWLFGGTGIIRHSTFTGNSGPFTIKADNATLTFDNNIVWGNGGTAMGRNNSTFAGTNNLLQSGDTTGLTHTINADPLLGSLFANGGPTRTFALLGDSPAIDAATTIFGVTTDQRGVARPVGAAPDLGAFENADTALQRWRAFHSLPANGSQDLANPSTDGVANLLKFAFNLAPNLGDLASSNTSILPENGTAGLPFLARDAQGRLFIEFVRRKATSHPGVGYLVETGADLSTLTPLDLSGASAVSIGATWERVTVIDPVITPKRFGRVRVTTLP
jgi:CSLREA domain-containing protein